MPRKIITQNIWPPIPQRHCDWVAYFDGEEEGGQYGYGETEQAAINDLMDNCGDEAEAA